LPETKAVLATIAKYNLVMETGHNTPQEVLMLIREGKRQGVKHIVVTHAMMAPIHMNIPQMKEAALMGAYIEFVYNGLVGSYKEFTLKDYAKAMHAVGVEHCIVGSDMGQTTNPVHTEALKIFYDGLLKEGVTQHELDLMARKNPATLLELN
jgi:predicted metal-dependent phosphotriesterase family hydrolase